MLHIQVPQDCINERRWICRELFDGYLGIPFALEASQGDRIVICHGSHSLTLPDTFFSRAKKGWLSPETLPALPLVRWDVMSAGLDANLIDDTLPVLFGDPGFRVDARGNGRLDLDVLGSAFFVLSRYEEVLAVERDAHQRFPAIASIACKEGFIDRPIVDEYAEVLWAAMRRVWPGLIRRSRTARRLISCDVDSAYVCGSKTLKGIVRRVGADLLIRRSPGRAMRSLYNAWRVSKEDYAHDPYVNAIHWMMDVNERAGNRVAFNFIASHSHATMDGCYALKEPVIRDLIREIHRRGHEIGLHASYNSYRDPRRMQLEAQAMRRILEEQGLRQEEMGGRQHYLRWETPVTGRNWEFAEMAYDSTLSYADRPGFRCGTSREFLMYDVVERRPLAITQRPLLVMESAFIPEQFIGVGETTISIEAILEIRRRCLQFDGDFTLLWHNSNLTTPKAREWYQVAVGA